MNILNPYRFSAVSGFLPTDISGLHLWLDADDSSTLLDNTTGGSPVGDGGNIARWNDKATNNNYCLQSNIIKQLTKQEGVVNGRDAIECDGTDKYLVSTNNIGINQTSAKTIFTCARPTTANDLTDGSCWAFPNLLKQDRVVL